MRYRQFGNTDLTVSEVGFGCARIGGVLQGTSRNELVDLLRSSVAAGITFFDTADMYTQGESERLIGDALRNTRQQVVIATKVGYTLPTQKRLISRIKPFVKPILSRLGRSAQRIPSSIRGTVSSQDFSPVYIRGAVEGSLRRLRTDYIDIYQLHSPPADVLQRGEFVSILDDLRREGKIRHWGVACERPEDAFICLQHPSLSSLQVAISALEPHALDTVLPSALARGTGVIARQIFASGLLTRSVSDGQMDSDPAVAEEKRQRLLAFKRIVDESGRSVTEEALGFVLERPEISVALVGMHRREHLADIKRVITTLESSAQPGLNHALTAHERAPAHTQGYR